MHQFTFSFKTSADAVGKSLYMDAFSVVGEDVDGTELPVSVSGMTGKWKQVWSLDTLSSEPMESFVDPYAWYGEYPGKLLTGMAYSYKLTADEQLLQAGNALADALCGAQGDDGYMGVFNFVNRMGANGNWDVWNHYHCIYGLYEWYRVSGDEDYLNSAVKAADYILGYFAKRGTYVTKNGGTEMNLAISHAFILLFGETGKQEYFDAAKKIVDEDWNGTGDWLNNALFYKNDYFESNIPRWEALHTIQTLGGLYEQTKEQRYLDGLENIWNSILKTDVHNHGAFSTWEKACGNPYRYGPVETCCTVAWMALSTELLQLQKNSLRTSWSVLISMQ